MYGKGHACRAGRCVGRSVEWLPTNPSPEQRTASPSPVRFFVRLVKIEPGLDIVAMLKSPPPFIFGQCFAAAIPPSVLRQEFVPDLNLLGARTPAALEAPLQNLLVRAAAGDALDQGRILNAEEARAARIEPGPIAGAQVIAGRKPAGGFQPNLVEHPPEEQEPTHLFVIAAQSWNFHDVLFRQDAGKQLPGFGDNGLQVRRTAEALRIEFV